MNLTVAEYRGRMQECAALGRKHLRDFMKFVWWMPHEFLIGPHTLAITDRLTQAVIDYENGISSFIVVSVPFRHGKTDIVSRALPAWFIGRCHRFQPDVMMSGYGSNLVESFSRQTKAIMRTANYNLVFPHIALSKIKNTAAKWAVVGSVGEVTAAGLSGGLTGMGGHLLVCDDYCKERKEAESSVYRDSTWEAFTNNLLTRRAPVSITVVCATPWHVDDVTGRIRKEMANDPYFPRFEFLRFPARSQNYKSGFLFSERFDDAWYESQYATLGKYAAAGLLDCDPTLRGGNMFHVANIDICDESAFPDTRYVRFWDLASTEKERTKNDPDYTAGALAGVTIDGIVPHLWIKDLVYGQWEAPKRDATILAVAERDGPQVRIPVESVGGYKDTYTTLRKILRGRRVVSKVSVSSDKVVRASELEPIFEAENVHIARGSWNQFLINQFTDFPSGDHDDVVDAVSGAFTFCMKNLPQKVDRTAWGL